MKHAALTQSCPACSSAWGHQELFVMGHNPLLTHFHVMMEQHSAFYSIVWEYQYNQGCVLFPRLLKLWDELLKWQISLFFGANASNQENGWIFLVFSFIHGLHSLRLKRLKYILCLLDNGDFLMKVLTLSCPW